MDGKHCMVFVHKKNVNGKGHEKSVDLFTRGYPQPLTNPEHVPAQQSFYPGQNGIRFLHFRQEAGPGGEIEAPIQRGHE